MENRRGRRLRLNCKSVEFGRVVILCVASQISVEANGSRANDRGGVGGFVGKLIKERGRERERMRNS
jgi:hypothetical protein